MSTSNNDGATTPFWLSALGIWLVLATAMLIAGFDRVTALDLNDSDDYMRLVQVERWLESAAWNDLTEPRMMPPQGVTLHWSRLPDLPIAAVISVAGLWTDRDDAAAAALLVVPTIYLLVFLLLISWIAARTFGPRTAPLAALLAAFAIPATGQFMPGRIDHHGLQVLLALVMLAGVLRIYAGSRRQWPVIIGIAAAVSLAIGVESLPQVAAAYAALALGWVLGRDGMLRHTVIMAVTTAAATALILLFAVPRNAYYAAACDSLSLAYGTAVALVAAGILALWIMDRWLGGTLMRLVASGLVLIIVAAVTLVAYPGCLEGPYTALPDDVKSQWLETIAEARGAFSVLADDPLGFILYFALPLIGLAVAVRGFITRREEAHWLPLAVFLITSLAVALLQIRGGNVANAIAIIAALPFYYAIQQWVSARARILPLLTSVLAMLLVSPTVIYALGQLAKGQAADEPAPMACAVPESLEKLKSLEQGIVMAPPNLGPVLLRHTDHAVIGANYHRNPDGIRHAIRFFTAESDEDARQILAETRADYIAFCSTPQPYGPHGVKTEGTLSYRLNNGDVPAWLTRDSEAMTAPGTVLVFRSLTTIGN